MMFVGLRLCASSQGIPVHHPRSLSVKSVLQQLICARRSCFCSCGRCCFIKKEMAACGRGRRLGKGCFHPAAIFAVLLPGRFTIVLPVYYTKKEGTDVRWSRIR